MAKQEFRVALTAAIPFSMDAAGLLAGIGAILAKAQEEVRKKHGVEMQLTQGVVTLRQPKGTKVAEQPQPTIVTVDTAQPGADRTAVQQFGGPGQAPTPEPDYSKPQPDPQPERTAPTPAINTAAPPPKTFAEMAAEAKAKKEAGQAG